MKRTPSQLTVFLAFLAIMTRQQAIAQPTVHSDPTDSVTTLFLDEWKAKDLAKMYQLLGDTLQKQYTPDVLKEVWESQMFKLGDLQEKKLIRSHQGSNTYKLRFDAITFSVTTSLDHQGKLAELKFEPYQDEGAKRSSRIASDNHLGSVQDSLVDSIMQAYFSDTVTVGASIGILANEKTYVYNYGETRRGNHQLPTSATIYEIGSITKTFTANLLTMASLEGKVHLNDATDNYLPADLSPLAYNGKSITLLSLANHSSGLPYMPANLNLDVYNVFKNYSVADLYAFLDTFRLKGPVGAKFEYSNTAFGVLGIILARLYHSSFDALVKTKITGPLGMSHTSQHIISPLKTTYATGHDDLGRPQELWEFKSMEAAGALHSNVDDLLKYARANLDSPMTKLQKALAMTHRTTFKTATQEIGLGWDKIPVGSSKVLLKTGGTGSFKTCIILDPKKHLAVVILSNQLTDTQAASAAILQGLQ